MVTGYKSQDKTSTRDRSPKVSKRSLDSDECIIFCIKFRCPPSVIKKKLILHVDDGCVVGIKK